MRANDDYRGNGSAARTSAALRDASGASALAAQTGRFILVGFISAGVDVGATWCLLRLALDYRVAVSLGFAAGLGVNYALHRSYTFRSQRPANAAEGVRYLAVVAINYLITIGIVMALHRMLGVDPLLAKLASLPVVFVSGFALSRLWIFRG